ncbi:hypothetical protein ABIB94_001117 [Bradyrhizobium sp. JR7.2]
MPLCLKHIGNHSHWSAVVGTSPVRRDSALLKSSDNPVSDVERNQSRFAAALAACMSVSRIAVVRPSRSQRVWRDTLNTCSTNCLTPQMFVVCEPAYERKVDVSGAVSGAVVAVRATKTEQGTDILGGPGRTRTCNQTVMSAPLVGTTIAVQCSSRQRALHFAVAADHSDRTGWRKRGSQLTDRLWSKTESVRRLIRKTDKAYQFYRQPMQLRLGGKSRLNGRNAHLRFCLYGQIWHHFLCFLLSEFRQVGRVGIFLTVRALTINCMGLTLFADLILMSCTHRPAVHRQACVWPRGDVRSRLWTTRT